MGQVPYISNGARPFLDTHDSTSYTNIHIHFPRCRYCFTIYWIYYYYRIYNFHFCFDLSTLSVKMDLAYVSYTGVEFRTTGNYR